MAQSLVEAVPKAADWLERVLVTTRYSAAVELDPELFVVISAPVEPAMLPAVALVVDLWPSSPIIISLAFDVDTLVTVGTPVVLAEAVLADPSNGLAVLTPEIPNTITLSPLVSLAAKVTVTEVKVEVVIA
jgi:hypothetical protein